MTTYTLSIGGNDQNYISARTELSNGPDPDPWSAILHDDTGTIIKEDVVLIKRNSTTIFQGILEHITEEVDTSGRKTYNVGGRHTKVKLWRKWTERYADKEGFFTSMYPHKVVEFLLRPSRSDGPERGDTYKRIGWGIDPKTMTGTASMATVTDRGANKTLNRLDLVGLESSGNQATNDYVEIDLGSAKDICAIIVQNKTGRPKEYARGYSIEVSTTGAWGGEQVVKASQSNNRAINIIESWTPGTSYRYIRTRLTANAAVHWSISNIFVYLSDGAISGISVGTLTEHLPFNVAALTQNADTTTDIYCKEYWRFIVGDTVIVGDDNGEEEAEVESIDSANEKVVLTAATGGTYTVVNNAYILNAYASTELNIEYSRRTEAIQKLLDLCMTDNTKWNWEVTNAGAVNMDIRTGTDVSGSISFVRGTNILKASAKDDNRKAIDKVLVLGGGKGDQQDINASGWIGSGEYEQVIIDTTLTSPEAARARAEQIIEEHGSGHTEEQIVVYDTYDSNTWGVDDDITITDAETGLSGTYRVKKVIRTFNMDSEEVIIQTTNKKKGASDIINDMMNSIDSNRQKQEQYEEIFDGITSDTRFLYKFEAEELILDSDVSNIYGGPGCSAERYIGMASTKSGNVIDGGPSFGLPGGKYRAVFVMQITDNSSSSDLCILKVKSSTEGAALETLTIQPDMFPSNDTWTAISFTFEVDEELNDLEFEIDTFVDSLTNLYVDFIGIQSNEIPDIPPGPPSAPTGLACSSRIEGTKVTWGPNTEADLSHYKVYRTSDGSEPLSSDYYVTVFVNAFFDSLSNHTSTYRYKVSAVDWAGNESALSSATAGNVANEIDSDWLTVETRPWTHNMEVMYYEDEGDDYADPDYDRIYWGLGGTWNEVANNPGTSGFSGHAQVKYADTGGTTVDINPGTQDALANGIHFLYWDEAHISGGDYDIQIASGVVNYGDAVGPGKGLIAIVVIDTTTPLSPSCLPVDSYTPHIGAGIINANSIISKHITGTEWIESKMFRTAALVGEIGGPAGVIFNSTGIYGYSGGVQQTFTLDSATGDVSVLGDGTFKVKTAAGVEFAKFGTTPLLTTVGLYAVNAQQLEIGADLVGAIYETRIQVGPGNMTMFAQENIVLVPDTGSIYVYNAVLPNADGAVDLGTVALKFGDIWGTAHYSDMYLSDLVCTKCGQPFKKRDEVTFAVKGFKDYENSDFREIVCVPVHKRCNPLRLLWRWLKCHLFGYRE